jgi:L-amino acid N-acyltransferase YncA
VTAAALQDAAGHGRSLSIRPMLAADWDAVHSIYAAGIATGQATFEREPPSWEAFDAGRLAGHRLVAEDSGQDGDSGLKRDRDSGGNRDGSRDHDQDGDGVLGWAAVSPVSARDVYRGVVEHSIYVAPQARGRGIGTILLRALIASTEADGIWTIQSSIFPDNAASLALHQRLGFRVVGVREKIARMSFGPNAGRWQDTLLLERRSAITGTD